MNKKGYTLIELLSVITLVAILLSVAVISYTTFINNANNRVYENYIDSMHEAAIMYFSKDSSRLPNRNETKYFCTNNCPVSNYISMSELGLSDIYNPKNENDKCLDSYIIASRTNESVISIDYHIYLKCTDYEKDKSFSN